MSSSPASAYLRAFSLGAVTGIRTTVGPALVSYIAWTGKLPGIQQTPLRFLRSPWTVGGLGVAVVGETIGDKLPATPSRTSPAPLVGRVVTGALVGAMGTIGKERSASLAAGIGALGAAAASYVFTYLRSVESKRLRIPNVAGGLLEDGLVAAVAFHVLRAGKGSGASESAPADSNRKDTGFAEASSG